MVMLIIHCGMLNNGHNILKNKYNWIIRSISDISNSTPDYLFNGVEVLFVDESQRINKWQLDMIIEKAKSLKIPTIFTYDTKQYLKNNENKDIYEYINENTDLPVCKKHLTNKIRTNKEMASFITKLFKADKNDDFDYKHITIEYFDDYLELKKYVEYLEEEKDWKAITYTTSNYNREPLSEIDSVCSTNAHKVIGQEFDKVVFVMNKWFSYNTEGELNLVGGYYNSKGMLYQIVTRVISELKILVLENPKVYHKLLEIKNKRL